MCKTALSGATNLVHLHKIDIIKLSPPPIDMKQTLPLIALCFLPAILAAQGNSASSNREPDEEEPGVVHPASLAEVFTLGLQATNHYYFTMQHLNAHIGLTALYDVYTDCQTIVVELLKKPVAMPNITYIDDEQYYGIFTLTLYAAAERCKSDPDRYEYDRLIEAATLYRMAYVIGAEYMDGRRASTPARLEYLNARAFEIEREAAFLLTTDEHLGLEEETIPQPPRNTPRDNALPVEPHQTMDTLDFRLSLLDILGNMLGGSDQLL